MITYATHEERYLPLLKKSCPDLVVLGMGKKWNGFQDKVYATIHYCKEHPNEIICFVDGFDSIVLQPNEILTRYESFQTPLVMSHAAHKRSVTVKYIQDKLYGKCKNQRLNSGMYIGTSEAIISFWEDFQGGEDQIYATQKCKSVDMKIDINHEIFYNYSPDDDIQVRNGQLYVNKVPTCVISCPGNTSINPYLKQLGYNPPEIKYDWNYRIRSYMKHFLPEVILVCIMGLAFMYFTFPLSLVFSFLLFTTFLEYVLNIKDYPIYPFFKGICLLIDVVHMFLLVMLFTLAVNFDCNLKQLCMLNTLYLIVVLCFFHFKRCIIAIVQNKIIQKKVAWTGPFDRIHYFLKPEKEYITIGTTKGWIESNKLTCLIIILLNLYCLFKN
jgi:hypothetical protein